MCYYLKVTVSSPVVKKRKKEEVIMKFMLPFYYYFLIILYVNCFGRTMLYMCIEYHI